ncbi:MAG: CotH kinase family protein [Deltaproteobacteria bacterium]|nr:CotH kinase family protein [Deltaproteobacteria bacterium]MBN2674388.1 CotH kinase family protein [Deltaproteobacteria bacterium]
MRHPHSFVRILFTVFVWQLLMISGCAEKKYADSSDDTETDSSTDSTSPPDTDDTDDSDSSDITVEYQNDTVFSQNKVLEYRITIDDTLLQQMNEFGNDEEYRNASLHVVGDGVDEQFDQVGFRFKGAWSLHHCWDEFGGVRSYEGGCARLSTKIKFDEYDDDARFFGLKRINLHAMMGDNTKLRDRLSYSLFNDFGVVAPRTAHANLYINDELVGLVIVVEQVDGRFTHFRFPDGDDGNLYKELWPSAGVNEDWALAQLRTNDNPEDNPDVSDFLNFKDAVAQSTASDFETNMASWLSLDNLLRYLAVDRATRNWDGIMGFYSEETSHNFYWYHDNGTQNIFHLIPWDLDNTMGEFDLFMDPQSWCDATPIPDWNETPLNCEARSVCTTSDVGVTPPRCDHFVDMLATTQWDSFTVIGNQLLADVLTFESMDAKITAWADQIRDSVAADPLLDLAQWESDVELFRGILKDAIYDFEQHLAEGLVDETIPTPLDESLLNDPLTIGGLRVDEINNFEFADAVAASLDSYITSFNSVGTDISHGWNSEAPVSGTGDLLFNADFVPADGTWAEYAAWEYWSDVEVDLNQYSYMWFSAKSNVDARMRIEFRSNNYSLYGNIWQTFSKEFALTPEPEFYRIDLSKLAYPQWAKDAWPTGAGWDTLDVEALEIILSKFTGLAFQTFPTWDDLGDTVYDNEYISIQVDNIYFE